MSLWPACPVTVSQRRVAIEVAGLAVWAEALPETKLTDEQVPFFLWTLASALPLDRGTIGLIYRPNPCIGCIVCIGTDTRDKKRYKTSAQTLFAKFVGPIKTDGHVFPVDGFLGERWLSWINYFLVDAGYDGFHLGIQHSLEERRVVEFHCPEGLPLVFLDKGFDERNLFVREVELERGLVWLFEIEAE